MSNPGSVRDGKSLGPLEKQTNWKGSNFPLIISGDKVRQAGGNGSPAAWFANVFVLPKVNSAGIHQTVGMGAIAIIVTTAVCGEEDKPVDSIQVFFLTEIVAK